jgi:hypothetical protein
MFYITCEYKWFLCEGNRAVSSSINGTVSESLKDMTVSFIWQFSRYYYFCSVVHTTGKIQRTKNKQVYVEFPFLSLQHIKRATQSQLNRRKLGQSVFNSLKVQWNSGIPKVHSFSVATNN